MSSLINSASVDQSCPETVLSPELSRPSPFGTWEVEAEKLYPQDFHPRLNKHKGFIDDVSHYKVLVLCKPMFEFDT